MNLILVNRNVPLPENYTPENLIALKDLPDRCFELRDERLLLVEEAAKALNSFIKAAKDAGLNNLIINSAYRTKEKQQRIFRASFDNMAAKPGHSEHETGLAVDIGVYDGSDVYPAWLSENCHNYGFIFRYPDYKEKLTGVRYEPWHFRYVGTDVAQYMKEKDICLEEYFEEKFGVPVIKFDPQKDNKSRERIIWEFLLKKTGNPIGTAALMGNLYAESDLRSEILQYEYHEILGYDSIDYTDAVDSGEYNNFINDCAGYGLAQWTLNVRKEGLLSYAESCNKSIGDLNMQLEYLWQEMCGEYSIVRNALINAEDIRTASDAVIDMYERPFDPSEELKKKRESFGRCIFYRNINKEQLEHRMNVLSLWREDISFLLMDYDTKEILYEKNSDKVRPIGSITKIMTAYVLADRIFSDENRSQELVKIDRETSMISMDPRYSGGEYLMEGESYSVDILLKLSLCISACASTLALVKHFLGSEENCIKLMNEKAEQLKLSGHFEDVMGAHPYSMASAKDLAVIADHIIQEYPQMLSYTSLAKLEFNGQEYVNTSRILRDGMVEGLDGFKTGTTPSAGKCYLATAQRKRHRVISVVLNALRNNERNDEIIELLEYGLS